MSSIFDRLGFDSTAAGGNVSELSSNTTSTVSQMPPLLNDWQKDAVATSNTSSLMKNSLETDIQNLWNVSNNIISITGLNLSNASNISHAANNLNAAANNFMGHTNRISGVSPVNSDTSTLPHYNTAIAAGKMVMYLVSQSDGIQNNAPIIGNFTSLFTSSNLVSYYATVNSYPTLVASSMSESTGGDPPTSTYTSNLSSIQIQTISQNINTAATFMNDRRTYDVGFYANCQSVISDFQKVKQFSNMGETEIYLINNFVGTEKLINNINS
jgi:hypothetical protein